jgi:hypothetical protein
MIAKLASFILNSLLLAACNDNESSVPSGGGALLVAVKLGSR